MHAALGGLRSSDLNQITVLRGGDKVGYYCAIDFSGGATDVDLANIVTLLIANVGSLRDHLKNWCGEHGVNFEGDVLINSNRSCALVHDLWNTDKHGKLTRPPRSGHHVRLVELQKGLSLSTGTEAGSCSVFSIDPFTGEMKTNSSGGGSVSVGITGHILDENNIHLGEFSQTVQEAVVGWEGCLQKAGALK